MFAGNFPTGDFLDAPFLILHDGNNTQNYKLQQQMAKRLRIVIHVIQAQSTTYVKSVNLTPFTVTTKDDFF